MREIMIIYRCLHKQTLRFSLIESTSMMQEKGEGSKAKMRELFNPLSDIKIAGRYVFKEVSNNIDEIESEKEGIFEVDYEHEYKELKKEIKRIRRENERQRRDAIAMIEKKYDLIEREKEDKSRKRRSKKNSRVLTPSFGNPIEAHIKEGL